MKKRDERLLSRREFARRAAMLSATASMVPAGALLSREPTSAPNPISQTPPALSEAGKIEAESRYQHILGLYGSRFDEEQKAELKRMCAELQPVLERVREFKLENGDAPALYLKPLVEREMKPPAASTSSAKKG